MVPGTAGRKYSFPEKISEADKLILKGKLVEVIKHVGDFRELGISALAKEQYHNWYMNIESSVHAKRLDTYALRLMALLAVNELKNEVDEDIVKRVIALCNWQLEVRKVHDPIDADNKVAKMEEGIRRVLARGPKKEYGLKQSVNANRAGLWVYETARKNLERAKEIRCDIKGNMWRLAA